MFSIITVAMRFLFAIKLVIKDAIKRGAQTFEMFDICNGENNVALFKRDKKSCFTVHPLWQGPRRRPR